MESKIFKKTAGLPLSALLCLFGSPAVLGLAVVWHPRSGLFGIPRPLRITAEGEPPALGVSRLSCSASLSHQEAFGHEFVYRPSVCRRRPFGYGRMARSLFCQAVGFWCHRASLALSAGKPPPTGVSLLFLDLL